LFIGRKMLHNVTIFLRYPKNVIYFYQYILSFSKSVVLGFSDGYRINVQDLRISSLGALYK